MFSRNSISFLKYLVNFIFWVSENPEMFCCFSKNNPYFFFIFSKKKMNILKFPDSRNGNAHYVVRKNPLSPTILIMHSNTGAGKRCTEAGREADHYKPCREGSYYFPHWLPRTLQCHDIGAKRYFRPQTSIVMGPKEPLVLTPKSLCMGPAPAIDTHLYIASNTLPSESTVM